MVDIYNGRSGRRIRRLLKQAEATQGEVNNLKTSLADENPNVTIITPTDPQVAQAVAEWMAGHPVQPGPIGLPGPIGPPVAEDTVAILVDSWLRAHPPAAGPQGRAPYPQEVADAVFAYLEANPIPPGLKGDPGTPGLKGDPGTALLATVNLTQTATVAMSAGVRVLELDAPGAVVGSSVIALPAGALPTGYIIHNAAVTVAGKVAITFTAPLLALGQNFAITLRVYKVG